MDERRYNHMTTYVLRDKEGNRLVYKSLPLIADLYCSNGSSPIEYKNFKMDDAIKSALLAVDHASMMQLPMGSLPKDSRIPSLAQGQSPLSVLCKASVSSR